MKLYATVSSERASKGQGGNEYLKIIIRNKKQHCIGYITFKPDNTCEVDIIKDINASFNKVAWIGTNDDTKGKKQKGEKHFYDKQTGAELKHCPECHKS